uniref:C2H2-type domain-containing protein n=1 Tax=Anopheles minimus TaxID=112268 RepID=A0A182VW59_9DIPT
MSYKWHHNFPKIAREAGFTIRELSAGHCIDWRFIASIDPYGIVGEQDYEKLDEFIPHISEVPIGSVLNNRILDPAIGKYFVLAQFSIQYLLFCKQFLDETVLEIRNTIQRLQEDNARLEKMNKKRNEEVTMLQRKLQRSETMEHAQVAGVIYPCSKCTKNFISPELLSAHMVRKHASIVRPAEPAFDRKPSSTDTNLINTIKLELEVKQLKERLNAAEKDLHNQRSKHHRCRVCSDDSSSATEKQPAKILHSVGIQSNLTDDKDLNDKEAQTQTDAPLTFESVAVVPRHQPKDQSHSADLISKSDLQSFLEEQKQLFESWKAGERETLNQQIESVKQNLVDVIQNMEKSERNTPVPEVEETVWKDRYKELEKMYEISQRQTQQAIGSFELAYTQKMEQIEKLLLEARAVEHTVNQRNTTFKHVNQPQSSSTSLKVVTLPKVTIESESITDCTKQMTEINDPTQENISSESEPIESEEELLHTIEAARKRQLITTAPRPVVTPATEPPKETKPQSRGTPNTLLISPKKQILAQFRARLKSIGVDPKSKKLFGDHLNVACKALADRREVQKQKHNHFFITRNQLLSKVDQLARIKVEETPLAKANIRRMSVDQPILTRKETNPSSSARVPATQPRLKVSSALELLPSKQKLHLPEMGTVESTDLNVFKSKSSLVSGPLKSSYRPTIKLTDDDIITVHADVSSAAGLEESITVPNMSKRASISSYDQQVERLLHTPIKTIHPTIATGNTQSIMSQENSQDNNAILDTAAIHPKPVPKKRVLFNLDKADNALSTPSGQQQTPEEYVRPQQKYDLQTGKVDEESDWNISSFDEDK